MSNLPSNVSLEELAAYQNYSRTPTHYGMLEPRPHQYKLFFNGAIDIVGFGPDGRLVEDLDVPNVQPFYRITFPAIMVEGIIYTDGERWCSFNLKSAPCKKMVETILLASANDKLNREWTYKMVKEEGKIIMHRFGPGDDNWVRVTWDQSALDMFKKYPGLLGNGS